MTQTPQILRETINKWYLLKLKNFCKAKDTVNSTKQQPTGWEKIFTDPTSDRGLISKIYKEFKKLDIKIPNNPVKNGVEIQKEFLTEESQMAEIHSKNCSTSLAIREMQIKMTLRYHHTPVRMAKIKKTLMTAYVEEEVE